ncbi:hypothetical protein D3C87_1885350 [compost metagenome]
MRSARLPPGLPEKRFGRKEIKLSSVTNPPKPRLPATMTGTFDNNPVAATLSEPINRLHSGKYEV